MSGTTSGSGTVLQQPSPRTGEKGKSSTTAETAAGESSKVKYGLAERIRKALEGKGSDNWLSLLSSGSDEKEDAANLWNIGGAAFHVLYVNVDDIRAWNNLYGPAPAVALAAFGRKTVWKMQAELLSRSGWPGPGGSGPGGPGPGGSGDPGDPDDPGDFGGPGGGGYRNGPYCPGWMNDPAAEEYKKTIEADSTRITISGTIITQIAVIALTLPSLSQTHWVARASWMFSLVSSLLAVYYATNQAWKTGYLLLGNRLRNWIRGHSKGPIDYVKEGNPNLNLTKLIRSLVPAPSSVLTVSAPGILLSASLCFLLVGFGIYLGFMWTRALDDLAGPDDSRDVFIIYIVSLAFCYILYSMSDAVHDRQATDTVRGIIKDSLIKLETRLNKSEGRSHKVSNEIRHERREKMEKQKLQLLSEQISLSNEMLKQLEETKAIMELKKMNPLQEDSGGRTPLSLAAAEGQE